MAELRKVSIGNVDQWLLIRGENRNNAVLFMLHGGPSAAQIGFNREYQNDLEKHYSFSSKKGAAAPFRLQFKFSTIHMKNCFYLWYGPTRYMYSGSFL